MRVHVTGASGFVGQHVTAILTGRHHDVVGNYAKPQALIHLAWEGLPNYEAEEHMANVGWQFKLIEQLGIHNVTVAGTIWETCPNPPAYVRAKLALWEQLQRLPITLKWVRAPYLYGDEQKPECLLPSLRRAVADGLHEFHVVPTSLPFLHVRDFAARLVDAMSDDRAHVANVPGVVERVPDFCRRHLPEGYEMEFIEDYPLREWEK